MASPPRVMDGLWLEEGVLSFRQDLPCPKPAPGEALLRLRLAGICSTDLELQRGYLSFTGIPGHEFVADVVSSPCERRWEGQRVVGSINAACGDCFTCRRGVPSHCPQRTVLGIVGRHGVFARYLTLPLANLHPVPDEVDDERAVFTEPLAAAVEVMQQIQLKPTDRVLVVGAGRLGQLIAAVLAGTGAELWALVRHDRPLPLLVAHGVATCREANLGELGPFDVTVEASGSPAGFALAVGAVRPRGRVVLKSTYAGQLTVDASALVVQEITLVGSRCGPFAPALRRLALGLDPRPLISGRYPLSQGLEAFGQAGDVGGRKVLLD